jgi:polyhydroxybutyrate depolymerase
MKMGKPLTLRIFEGNHAIAMRKLIFGGVFCIWAMCCHAQIITGSFAHASNTRAYDLHLPTSWTTGSRLPLVLDLHYLGADGRDEDSLTQFNPIADAEGFIVCHPYGLGTNWNVGQNMPYSSGELDVDFISTLIDTLDARYGVNLSQVYAVGMGQGGFMAHRLACGLGSRIAAVAAVGASIADSTAYYCQGSRPLPLMLIHGTADSVVPYFTGLPGIWPPIPDLIDFWSARNACAGAPVITNLPDLVSEGSTVTTQRWTCAQGAELLLYQVVNGGFAWPGATRDLGSGGNRNMDIDASQHIWDFFKRYDINGLVAVDESVTPSNTVSVFPNPASTLIHVTTRKAPLGQVYLHDLQGRVLPIVSTQVALTELEIDLKDLPNGVYFLLVGGQAHRVAVCR